MNDDKETDTSWLGNIDYEAIDYLFKTEDVNGIKRDLIKQGYQYQISLYGVLTRISTESSAYKRIEIFKDRPWDEASVMYIKEFFVQFPPERTYTLWQYNSKDDSIRQVAEAS